MLTSEDIKNLIQAEKEVFATKDDFNTLKADFSLVTSSIDGYAKKADTYHQEMSVLLYKVQRMQRVD